MEKVKMTKLNFNPFSRSPVDIIIPFHGKYEKVTKLLESILNVTRSNPYEIILVDDFSPNSTFIATLKDVPQVVTLRTPKHLGFGGALEYGMLNSHQPWVMFMHSDCTVEDPSWMIEMGKSLLKWKDSKIPVKMVSARSNNPGDVDERLISANKDEKIKDAVLDSFIPLFCAMCHRDLFRHIRGPIKNYFPFGYEDEELHYRMKRYGFKQGVCGNSWIRHEGGATTDSVCKNSKLKEMAEKNRDQCIQDIRTLYTAGLKK